MKVKQEYTEVEGIRYAICPICKEKIVYPFGVYFRNGAEVHIKCIAVARMRRGAIQGIDK